MCLKENILQFSHNISSVCSGKTPSSAVRVNVSGPGSIAVHSIWCHYFKVSFKRLTWYIRSFSLFFFKILHTPQTKAAFLKQTSFQLNWYELNSTESMCWIHYFFTHFFSSCFLLALSSRTSLTERWRLFHIDATACELEFAWQGSGCTEKEGRLRRYRQERKRARFPGWERRVGLCLNVM